MASGCEEDAAADDGAGGGGSGGACSSVALINWRTFSEWVFMANQMQRVKWMSD